MSVWKLKCFNNPTNFCLERDHDELSSIEDQVNTLFKDVFGDIVLTCEATYGIKNHISDSSKVRESISTTMEDDIFKITAKLPGLEPNDVRVAVANHYIVIAGLPEKPSGGKSCFGGLRQIVAMPDTANMQEAHVSMSDGLLVITIPKAKELHPKVHYLKINQNA